MKDYLLTILYMILAFLLVVVSIASIFHLIRPAQAQTYSKGIPFEWRVVDGDTISTVARPRLYFRLAGFDTPEITRPRCDAELLHGTKAKQYLSDLLASPDLVWFNSQLFDRYGRALIYIWIKGRPLADLMVEANFGVYSNGKSKYNWCVHLKTQH